MQHQIFFNFLKSCRIWSIKFSYYFFQVERHKHCWLAIFARVIHVLWRYWVKMNSKNYFWEILSNRILSPAVTMTTSFLSKKEMTLYCVCFLWYIETKLAGNFLPQIREKIVLVYLLHMIFRQTK